MAKKILARDEASMAGTQLRDSGRKPPKKGMPYEVGSNRPKRPPSDPTVLAMSVRDATDATYTEKGNPGQDPLDQKARDRHDMRKGWFLTEAHRQSVNRQRMAKCEAMYDSEQWEYQDAQVLRDRLSLIHI